MAVTLCPYDRFEVYYSVFFSPAVSLKYKLSSQITWPACRGLSRTTKCKCAHSPAAAAAAAGGGERARREREAGQRCREVGRAAQKGRCASNQAEVMRRLGFIYFRVWGGACVRVHVRVRVYARACVKEGMGVGLHAWEGRMFTCKMDILEYKLDR